MSNRAPKYPTSRGVNLRALRAIFFPQTPNITQTRRAVQFFLGNRGRIWKTATGFDIGLETNPGRHVLGSGASLPSAFRDTFLDLAQQLVPTTNEVAPGTTIDTQIEAG